MKLETKRQHVFGLNNVNNINNEIKINSDGSDLTNYNYKNKEIEGFGAFDQMNMAMKKLREDLPKEIAGRKNCGRKRGKSRSRKAGKN